MDANHTKSNLLDGDFERQQIEVHIGGPTIVKRLIDAAAAPLDNKASNSDGDNMSRRNIPRGALPEGKEWIDRVARMEKLPYLRRIFMVLRVCCR